MQSNQYTFEKLDTIQFKVFSNFGVEKQQMTMKCQLNFNSNLE